MSIITKTSAKNYFLTGNFPTQAQFADTIDTYLGLGEAGSQTVQGPLTFSSPLTMGGAITVSGDITATGGRVTASAATLTAKLTGQAASFSAIVSADGGINTQTINAASLAATGDISASTGRVTASAATINSLLTGATASFSSIVSAATVDTNNLIINGASIVSAKGTTSVVATVSGSVTAAHIATWDASGNLTDGGTAPSQIMTALAVGSIIQATYNPNSTLAANATTAASNLIPAALKISIVTGTSDTITGTWKALQAIPDNSGSWTILWQRTV